MGTLLGDGILELNGRYPRLRIDHSIKQGAYVEWKYRVFHDLTSRRIRFFYRKKDYRTKKRYGHYRFDTISTPLLNEFYRMFYLDGRKRVTDTICKALRSSLSLAVWFMDDGYKRNDCNALRINTDSFNLKEQKLLLNCLETNFAINARLHRKGKYWNIYIPSLETKKFCEIVKPYVIPEINYKISLTP